MEPPCKLSQQIAINTGPKIEEHMLKFKDKSTHHENLSQPLQNINKQFKIAVTFLTGYNGIFDVTEKKNGNSFSQRLLMIMISLLLPFSVVPMKWNLWMKKLEGFLLKLDVSMK